MILRNEDGITIETYDDVEIARLKGNGYKSIYEDKTPLSGKKKVRAVKRSTRGTKVKRSTS